MPTTATTMPTKKTRTVRALRDARASATGRRPALVPVRLSEPAGIRAATTRLYTANLRSHVSRKAGDLLQPKTIEGYLEALAALEDYLQEIDYQDDYPDLTAEALNGFLRSYRAGHTQGGTNTKQRRLRPFFNWLAEAFDTPNPYTAGLVDYYAPSKPSPAALGKDVPTDLVATAKGKDFESVRDRAILLLLSSGVRRGEIGGLHVEDLDLATTSVQVGALKGARRDAPVLRLDRGQEQRAGRLVPFGRQTALALHQYLRLRAQHKLVEDAESGPLWYATRGRGRLTDNGIWRMIKRRAAAAGYDPATITVHAFRHTRTHELLAAGVSEGDTMQIMGWEDRAMVRRYASNLATERAHAAVRAAGLVR